METQRYREFRRKWMEHRKIERGIMQRVAEAMPRARPKTKAILTRGEYEAIHEAVLVGMKHMANEDRVDSLRFKALRSAWSKIAPVHGQPAFTIEVKGEN